MNNMEDYQRSENGEIAKALSHYGECMMAIRAKVVEPWDITSLVKTQKCGASDRLVDVINF